MGNDLSIYVSPEHLDPSVRTGVPGDFYKSVSLHRVLGKRAFIQTGFIGQAMSAQTSVIDLNPRSLTAWIILTARLLLRRRTLVWGHIHPQAGVTARTAGLRRLMRRMSAGTISYTYRDAEKAKHDLPGAPVWTAPNSLYRNDDIEPAAASAPYGRTDIIYVGRFAPSKKVKLLIQGFAEAAKSANDIRLKLIGGGAEEDELRALAKLLGVEDKISFPGWIDDLGELRTHYSTAFCSASPGFAGLGLTQSLGFGIPMIVARDEPHSPEIELEETGAVHYFDSDSPLALSTAILALWKDRAKLPDTEASAFTKRRYSAEAMAEGIESALLDRQPRDIYVEA